MVNALQVINALTQQASGSGEKSGVNSGTSVSDTFLELLDQIFSNSGKAVSESMEDLRVEKTSTAGEEETAAADRDAEKAAAIESARHVGACQREQTQETKSDSPAQSGGDSNTDVDNSTASEESDSKAAPINCVSREEGSKGQETKSAAERPDSSGKADESPSPSQGTTAQSSAEKSTDQKANTVSTNAPAKRVVENVIQNISAIAESEVQATPTEPASTANPISSTPANQTAQAAVTALVAKLSPSGADVGDAKLSTSLASKFSIDSLVQQLKVASRIDSLSELFSPSNSSQSGGDAKQMAKQGSPLKNLPQSSQTAVIEKLKEAIEKAAANRTPNSFVVRLDPPELGELNLKVSFKDDQMFVRVASDRPEVEDFIRNRAPEMVQVLAAAGFRSSNVHVSVGRDFTEAELFGRFFNAYQDSDLKGENSFYKKGTQANLVQDLQEQFSGPTSEGVKTKVGVEAGWVA